MVTFTMARGLMIDWVGGNSYDVDYGDFVGVDDGVLGDDV